MAKIIEVIYVEAPRGFGTDKDPCRIVQQWFQKDGTLIYERDDHARRQEFLRTEADVNREVQERVMRELRTVTVKVPKVAKVILHRPDEFDRVLMITHLGHNDAGDYIVGVEE